MRSAVEELNTLTKAQTGYACDEKARAKIFLNPVDQLFVDASLNIVVVLLFSR
jgi:hypothetical protein